MLRHLALKIFILITICTDYSLLCILTREFVVFTASAVCLGLRLEGLGGKAVWLPKIGRGKLLLCWARLAIAGEMLGFHTNSICSLSRNKLQNMHCKIC